MRYFTLIVTIWASLACGEPQACVELRQEFCQRCGDRHPRCVDMHEHSDSAARCEEALARFTKRMSEIEALDDAQREQKLEFLCRTQ